MAGEPYQFNPFFNAFSATPQFVSQGWQCPVCATVYAPSVRRCNCAKAKTDTGRTDVWQPKTAGDALPPKAWTITADDMPYPHVMFDDEE